MNFFKRDTSGKLMLFGISFTVALVLTIGVLSIYFISQASLQYQSNIEAINLSRQAQLQLDRQYYNWKTIMLEGDDFATYKKKYHEYSYSLTHASDLLFNLKLLLSGKTIEKEVKELLDLHSSLSGEYLKMLVALEKTGYQERKKSIDVFKEKENALFAKMNQIVERIQDESTRKSEQTMQFYLQMITASIFILALAGIIMGFFISRIVARSQKYLEKKIERRTRDLQNAHAMLSQSEKRYRRLVEGTGDIIFTLNNNLEITNINQAMKKIFGLKEQELIGKNLINLIYEGSDGRGMSRQIIAEMLDNFVRENSPVSFIADFKSPLILEPKTLRIQLEQIEAEGSIEILGKGTPIADSHIQRYLVYERLSLIAENYLGDAEEISFRITRALSQYVDQADIMLMRIGLREMIINAIEHGNLEVSYDEKTKALQNNTYFELLSERRKNPIFSERKVTIDSIIGPTKAIFRITDDGNGFDVNTYAQINNSSTETPDAHGRGILMARQIFHQMRYNKKGNQVILVRYYDEKEKHQEISGKGLSHCQPVLPVSR